MNERLDWKQALGRECNYLMIVLVQVGDDQALDEGGSHMKKYIDVRVLGHQTLIDCVLDSAAWN